MPSAARSTVVIASLASLVCGAVPATADAPGPPVNLKLESAPRIKDAVGPGGTRSVGWAIFSLGGSTARESKLTLTFPNDMLVGTLTAPGGRCQVVRPNAICPLGDLVVGDRVTVVGNFASRINGRKVIKAVVSSAGTETSPADNTGETGFDVDALAPDLSAVAFSKGTWLFQLSEKASVTLTFDAGPLIGKRSGARCLPGKPATKRQACHYVVRQKGEVVYKAKKGENRFKFNAKVGGKTLKPGRYIVRLSPKDPNNNIGIQRKKSVLLTKK